MGAAILLIVGLVFLNGIWRLAWAATDAVTKPKRRSKGKRKRKTARHTK
ncbi:hypothetical protein [Staphylospora marina]|nr:hypothetical protein [Staphylospora marina]